MIEFIAGAVAGGAVAAVVGRAKFLQVQKRARQFRNLAAKEIDDLYSKLNRERNLTTGLTQELDAVAQKSRITTTA